MKAFAFAVLSIVCAESFAQDDEKQRIIERRIEFIGENLEDSDLDLTAFLDEMYHFLEEPINLNQTHFEELSRLHLLSDVQMQSIINYRNNYGAFITIYELKAIEELDEITIEMILPFVTVGEVKKDEFNWKNVFTRGSHEIFTRYDRVIQQKTGYIEQPDSVLAENPNKQYLGSPDHLYFRYRTQYKDRVSWGVTAEKDAGEQFFRGTQKQGFDFYSGHFFLKNFGVVKKLAIGDYQLGFGQGLTMWSSFQMGKSGEVMSAKRMSLGLRPYTSVNEARYLRGAGVTLGFKKIEFTAFGSYKRLDANLITVDTSTTDLFDAGFSSFQISGYHRLQSEIDDKKAIQEGQGGTEVAYLGEKFRIGFASVYTRYDQALIPSTSHYNQYDFAAKHLLVSGINYRGFFKKLSMFGETSMSDNYKIGSINGLTWHIDSRVDLMLVQRYYDKEFHSLYSAGFGEGNGVAENGVYIGILARMTKRINVSAYYDQWSRNFLKYLTDDYSTGREFFTQMDIKLNWSAKMHIRFRSKISEQNTRDDVLGIKDQVDLNKTNVRLHYEQQVNKFITIKSRAEWVRFKYGEEVSDGLLLFQDIGLHFQKIPLNIYGRYAIFDTDSYDSRVYAYENDLLYVFSIPSYYYRGMRAYVMVKYEIGRWADIWLRWGIWSYENRDVISSGMEEIQGSRKSDIKVQLKIRL